MTFRAQKTTAGIALAVTLLASPSATRAQTPQTLNVHTTRDKATFEPLLQVFEGLTRLKITTVYLASDPSSEITTRLQADAASGKVDMFIASDLSQLIAAKSAGITEPVDNADLADRVPAIDRDTEGHWFGLTRRVRVIATSRERVKLTDLSYEDLADPKWKGKVCARSGLHPSNVMLTASIIEQKGSEATEAWLRGVKGNLAGKPTGGDRDQLAAVQAGRCDLALVDSDEIGRLRASTDAAAKATGNAVNVVFPNAAGRGAHVNLSGMALIKDAPGLNNAALLMDFLTSQPTQFVYAQATQEYPVRADVEPSGIVASFGKPKLDEAPLFDVAKHEAKAVELIGKTRFDDGPGS